MRRLFASAVRPDYVSLRAWTICLVAAVAVVVVPGLAASSAGAALATPLVGCPPAPKIPPEKTILRPRWLADVLITEYFPAPERWFDGRLVRAPGLAGVHRIDWLYSARGLAMQGEGIGVDGRLYHFAGPYSLSWRNGRGGRTDPCLHAPGFWTNGAPAWIGSTRLSQTDRVTYPLPGGGWSNGPPARVVGAYGLARFAPGASLRLSYWHDAAVDPRLIPHGSRIFVPAFCGTPSDGWFIAADTGGAIIGRHIDVFRSPPHIPWDDALLRHERIYVVPPGFSRPAGLHC